MGLVVKSGGRHYGSWSDKAVCEAYDGDKRIGVASVDHHNGLHFNVDYDRHRQGVCTAMVTHLLKIHPEAVFTNDPSYKGTGMLSNYGKQFVEGWKRKHLTNPKSMV